MPGSAPKVEAASPTTRAGIAPEEPGGLAEEGPVEAALGAAGEAGGRRGRGEGEGQRRGEGEEGELVDPFQARRHEREGGGQTQSERGARRQAAHQRAQAASGDGEEEEGDGEAEGDQPQALVPPEVRPQRGALEVAGRGEREQGEAAIEVLAPLLAHLVAAERETDLDRHHEPPGLPGHARGRAASSERASEVPRG